MDTAALHAERLKTEPWTRSTRKLMAQFMSPKPLQYNVRQELLRDLTGHLTKESFVYRNIAQRVEACNCLLDCAAFLLEHVDGALLKDRPLYFQCIIFVLRRREFDVAAFEIDYATNMVLRCPPAIMVIMTRFRNFLYVVQDFVVTKLSSRGVYASLNSFCIAAIALNFFYIGAITSRLINALWSEADETDEQKYPEVTKMIDRLVVDMQDVASCKTDNGKSQAPSRSVQVFCSIKYAISELPLSDEFAELAQRVTQGEWIQRFRDEKPRQYKLLAEIISHADYLTNGHTDWCLMPGYFQMLHPVLIGMTEEAPAFTRRSVTLSKILLSNMRLLNVFMKIAFEATNVHDTVTTVGTIALVGEWFGACRDKHEILHLPDYIDYDILFLALTILLDIEHFSVLISALSFLYDYLLLFPLSKRAEFLKTRLLGKKLFYKLFLHWNAEVRMIFTHILVYKVFCFEVVGQSTDGAASGRARGRRTRVNDDEHVAIVEERLADMHEQFERDTPQVYPPCSAAYVERALAGYSSVLEEYYTWRRRMPIVKKTGAIVYPSITFANRLGGD